MSISFIVLSIFILLYFHNIFKNFKKSNFNSSIILLFIIGFSLMFLQFLFFKNKYIYLYLSPFILLINTRTKILTSFVKFTLLLNLLIIILEYILFYSYGKIPLEFLYNSGYLFNLKNIGVVIRNIDGFEILRPRGLTGDLHVSAFLIFILILTTNNNLFKYFTTLILFCTNSVQTIFSAFANYLKNTKYVINLFPIFILIYFIMSIYLDDGTSSSTIAGIISGFSELYKLTIPQLLFGILDLNSLTNFEIDAAENIESGFVKLIILYGIIILSFLIIVLIFEAKRYSHNSFYFFFNLVIIYLCFAHSSVGSSIWIFPLLYLVFEKQNYNGKKN